MAQVTGAHQPGDDVPAAAPRVALEDHPPANEDAAGLAGRERGALLVEDANSGSERCAPNRARCRAQIRRGCDGAEARLRSAVDVVDEVAEGLADLGGNLAAERRS